MKKLVLAMMLAGAALGAASSAEAAQGCGPGWHRGFYGRCRPNRPPVFVAPDRLVVGVYYPHHGWWDGHRYWGRRFRWHGGWRYR